MPVRRIDRRARVVLLLRMAEPAPPDLHHLGEVARPFERGDAERTIKRAIEDPIGARAAPARPRMAVVLQALGTVTVAMALPGGAKVAPRLETLRAEQAQVDVDEAGSGEDERHRQDRQI